MHFSVYFVFFFFFKRKFRFLDISTKGKHTDPPMSLIGQLMWREFFYTCGATIENFNRMKGNKICRQIPWREDKDKYLSAWKNAQTGYPFIDAIMTQLKQEGKNFILPVFT